MKGGLLRPLILWRGVFVSLSVTHLRLVKEAVQIEVLLLLIIIFVYLRLSNATDNIRYKK